MTRRRFVRAGAAAIVLAGVPIPRLNPFLGAVAGAAPARAGGAAGAAGADVFSSASNFTPLVNTVFHVRSSTGSTAELRLTRVDQLPAIVTRARTTTPGVSFSLTFDGGRRMSQNSYTVQHASLGTFSMFLVPAGSGTASTAVVNRLPR